MDYEITPEPSEDERAAIAAALAELDDRQSGWTEAALPAPEEPSSP